MRKRTENSAGAMDIARNVSIHNRVAKKYERTHGEIFNDIEQQRLKSSLSYAVDAILSKNKPFRSIDFGCGSGNLTKHLLDLGLYVTAADVSKVFLERINKGYDTSFLSTLHLENGQTRCIPDHSYDLVATYSVLHHIPDYIGACREMARICRHGGIVYIDHEHTEEYWDGGGVYGEFKAEALSIDWRKYFKLSNYYHWMWRRFNPKHTNEGDIHVWPDDHIKWSEICKTMTGLGFDVVLDDNYLLYHKLYRKDVYLRYSGLCSDMKVMAFRKVDSDTLPSFAS